MKSQVYRKATVLAFALGLLGLLVGCLDLSVSFETPNPDTSDATSTNMRQLNSDSEAPILNTTNISSTATVPANQGEKSSPAESILVRRQNEPDSTKAPGTLRMSNQTDQPVRLALLARQLKGKGSTSSNINQEIPAHWDFAPQEGSNKGLLLSLPNGSLKLEKGDILVAFAQDGSRRYWGPYIVGETSLPKWNAKTKEWVLVLTP